MSSTDVIHSFWVPEFRVKQDVLPGADMVKELRMTPTLLGSYKVRCAELCGTSHAYMESPVVVLEQTAFDAWVKDQSKVSDDPVVRGQKLATQSGCAGCHSIDGKVIVGPSWKGIYGEQVILADGSSVAVDDTYLHTAIVDPNAQIVKGFNPNIMPPTYAKVLTDAQISDLIAYIKSLK
jgi:cytochrome c oxidase subunit 2